MWWAVAAAALGSTIAGVGKRAQAKANNKISAAQTEASNKLRTLQNQAAAAENSMALWSQSVENGLRAKQAARTREAGARSFLGQSNQQAAQGLSLGIQEAEAMGAATAAIGASAVEGSAPNLVRGATALRSQFAEETADRLGVSREYAGRTQAGALAGAIFTGMDQSVLLARMDYNVDAAVQQATSPGWVDAASGALNALGSPGSLTTSDTRGQFTTQNVGLATRDRSVGHAASEGTGASWSTDLADHSFDTGQRLGDSGGNAGLSYGDLRFGDVTPKSSNPYSIW